MMPASSRKNDSRKENSADLPRQNDMDLDVFSGAIER